MTLRIGGQRPLTRTSCRNLKSTNDELDPPQVFLTEKRKREHVDGHALRLSTVRAIARGPGSATSKTPIRPLIDPNKTPGGS